MSTVYGFSKVNAKARGNACDLRVLWPLEELQLPLVSIGLDRPAHDSKSEAFRKPTPFGQIPVIDDDRVILSESTTILICLGQKVVKLIPPDPAAEMQVVRWHFAAMNSIEIPLPSLLQVDCAAMGDEPTKHRENTEAWVHRRLPELGQWFDGRDFVATEPFTAADLLMAHVPDEFKDEELIRPYPGMTSYRDRWFARPGWTWTLDNYLARVETG